MLGKRVAIVVVFVAFSLAVTLAINPVAAQVTPSPSTRANATSNGGPKINVQLSTAPRVSTPSSPSPSPITIVEHRSGPGGISSLLSLLSSWLWLLLIVLVLLLIIVALFLLTRPPRYHEYGPEDGYYEETHRVTRRRRRY